MAAIFKDRNNNKITIQSLTFGYLEDVEDGVIEESLASAVLDATTLSMDDLRSLTRLEVNEIFEIVKRETYPELYNEDGTPKEIGDEPEEDKKKA